MVNLLSIALSGFAGMVLTALLSPLFSEKIIRLYSGFGLFHPDVSLNASVTKSFYDEGEPVSKYNDMEWKSSYEIFSLKVKNQGNTPIYNIRLSLFFPGFVRVAKSSPSGATNITLESPHNNIELFNHQSGNVIKPCSQRPQIGQIDEHGEVLLEFVIDTDISKDGPYAFWNPTEEINGSLSWEAKGVRLQGEFTETVTDDVGIYDNISEPEGFTLKMDEYPFPDSNPELTFGVLDDPTENPLYEKYKDKTDPEHLPDTANNSS